LNTPSKLPCPESQCRHSRIWNSWAKKRRGNVWPRFRSY